jgi:hypothetical protein
MRVDPTEALQIRGPLAQRHRLTTNKIFDPADPEVKARLDTIEQELRHLGAAKALELT